MLVLQETPPWAGKQLRLHPTQGLAGLALIRATFSQIPIKELHKFASFASANAHAKAPSQGAAEMAEYHDLGSEPL